MIETKKPTSLRFSDQQIAQEHDGGYKTSQLTIWVEPHLNNEIPHFKRAKPPSGSTSD